MRNPELSVGFTVNTQDSQFPECNGKMTSRTIK